MSPFHEIDGPAGDEADVAQTQPPRRRFLEGEYLLNLADDAVRGVDVDFLETARMRLEIAEACIRIREALRSGTAP